jgi:hypothetical protein
VGPFCLIVIALLRSDSEKVAGVSALWLGMALMIAGMLLYTLLNVVTKGRAEKLTAQ